MSDLEDLREETLRVQKIVFLSEIRKLRLKRPDSSNHPKSRSSMATKGLVLTTAERPVFVRSSPVHQSLQITKDVATRPPVCAPTRALRKVEASPTGTELGEQQTGSPSVAGTDSTFAALALSRWKC
ncbi:uncharacterized protein AAG666_014022 isoform 1-T1 [Megaptera novaeangliae]